MLSSVITQLCEGCGLSFVDGQLPDVNLEEVEGQKRATISFGVTKEAALAYRVTLPSVGLIIGVWLGATFASIFAYAVGMWLKQR